ncbi:crotonase [Deltaproteobacteria bacterium]|nr:crotonase [Deltaproteobacteria bacterium]
MAVSLSVSERVAVVTLDDPATKNALRLEDWRAMRDALRGLDDVRAIVVTGSNGNFSAGLNLTALGVAALAPNETQARRLIEELKDCVAALAELQIPSFAAIEGVCIGGALEIALGCDVRIAGEGATFSLPEVRLGMIPDVGGCARLTRLVGPGRAADLITTGRSVSGSEAFQLGFVERTVSDGAALTTAMEAARRVCNNAPDAVRLALTVVRAAGDLDLEEAMAIETHHGVLALTSGEAAEGITAFREKRAPKW